MPTAAAGAAAVKRVHSVHDSELSQFLKCAEADAGADPTAGTELRAATATCYLQSFIEGQSVAASFASWYKRWLLAKDRHRWSAPLQPHLPLFAVCL